jgi:hypothetical protein
LPSAGSITSQVRISVVSSKKGSMLAVFGSGMSCMSEASMPFQPAMEEPSKAWTVGELAFVESRHRHGHVLFFTAGVGEAKVDELDLVFLDELQYIGDGLCHQFLLVG